MSTNIIKLNRGDSFSFNLFVHEKHDVTEKHLLEADEAVYFALMCPNQAFEQALIVKGYDLADQKNTGEILIELNPNDTRYLSPGIYYYTVKLRKSENLTVINSINGPSESRTLIERTKFIINE